MRDLPDRIAGPSVNREETSNLLLEYCLFDLASCVLTISRETSLSSLISQRVSFWGSLELLLTDSSPTESSPPSTSLSKTFSSCAQHFDKIYTANTRQPIEIYSVKKTIGAHELLTSALMDLNFLTSSQEIKSFGFLLQLSGPI